MTSKLIYVRRTVLAILVFLAIPLVSAPAAAQTQQKSGEEQQSDDLPWLYKGSDVPIDKSWTFGVLPNGLRYAVKDNGAPPGQVSIRLRLDVGSLMEREDEKGYAHFLEHLAFRGSKYVPDGEAKRVWQRFGVTFGSDSNAETSFTHTVYKLDLPNASRESLDESLKIISGMVTAPGLNVSAVDAERPVVLSEMIERSGAPMRVQNASRDLFFAGQRLASHEPIGTPETLNSATPAKLQLFHQRWYRPENAVLVMAGDGNPAIFEQYVKKHFSSWRGKGEAGVTPDFGKPTSDTAIAKTIIEPTMPRFISMATVRAWEQVDDTIAYNQQILVDLLALQMINRRLEAKARAGGNFLQASVSQDDVARSVDGLFVNIVPLDDDWQSALRDVRSVIADATTNAPSLADIARELSEFDAALAVGVEGYASEEARKQADSIIHAVDIREAVATPQVALDVFRAMRADFSPERLLSSTQKLFEGTATRALLVSPTAVEGSDKKLTTALLADVKASENARLGQEKLSFDALPKIGKKGRIVQSSKVPNLDVEQLELSNGVRVIMFPNDGERNKIMVNVRFGHGYGGLSSEEQSLVWSGPMALTESGVGEFGQEELDKITTGRRIGLNFSVDDDAFELTANTRPADLEDQLHLMAAKLDDPRWDPAPVKRARAASLIGYDSYSSSPQTILERDLKWLVRDRDPRWKSPDREDFGALDAEKFKTFWAPILESGPIEVMLFGEFDRDQAVDAILKTFGALKKRKSMLSPSNMVSPKFPEPNPGPEILVHKGDEDRAAAMIAWPTGGGLENVRESRQLEAVAALFNDRLFEILRTKQGASYSPQVVNSWPLSFESGGYIGASSQLTPDNIDRFFDVSELIAKDLREKPVDPDELKRVIEPLRQLIARATTSNGFWMSQMEGASFNPKKLDAIRTLMSDYTVITPLEVQALAQKYLKDSSKWKLVVLPEDKTISGSGD